MVIVSMVPLIFVGGVALYYYSKSSRENVIAYQKALVHNHKIHIDDFLVEKLSDIQILVDMFPIEKLLNNNFLRSRLKILKNRYGDYVDIGIIDTMGFQRAYEGPFKLEDATYSNADWFKKAMKRDYYISDVFLGLRGIPHFIIAVKVKDNNGKRWIIRSTIDIEKFTSIVENIKIGKTGHAFILNTKGEFQTKHNSKEKGFVPLYSDIAEQNILKQGVSIFESEDESGNEIIYAVSFLKNGDWLLVCQQNSDDAFSRLNYVKYLIIVISIIALISVFIISFLVTRNLVHDMQKKDQERTRLGEQVIESGKFAAIGELAAGIAHEVNNPVAIMVEEAGWLEDLLEEGFKNNEKNQEEFSRALKQIKVQGHRCKQITHKLLTFARKSYSQTTKIKFNELIEEVVGLSKKTARYSNITIDTNIERYLPEIIASSSEIQQLLLNLVNNAIDAIGKDGGKVIVTAREEDEFIIIDVSDTGSGIPEANVSKIFDPFFTTKPVGKGTGIGLAICNAIVYRMGGQITVDTAIGKGTTFHVFIPKEQKENIINDNEKEDVKIKT